MPSRWRCGEEKGAGEAVIKAGNIKRAARLGKPTGPPLGINSAMVVGALAMRGEVEPVALLLGTDAGTAYRADDLDQGEGPAGRPHHGRQHADELCNELAREIHAVRIANAAEQRQRED